MQRIHGRSICLGLGILILGLGVATAQVGPEDLQYTAGFDPEQFAASADPDQIGLVDGARTQANGSLAVGLAFHFAGPALSVCVRDLTSADPTCQVEGDILHSRFRADLGVLYGFGRFDVRLSLPFVLHQTTDFSPPMGEEPLGSAGVGGPTIGGRFQIARPGPMNLAADLGISIPSGGANFIGDHGLVIDPRLLVDVRKGPFSVGVNVGYRFRQESAKVADLYVDDEVTWSAAAQYWIVSRKLAIGAAAYGRIGIMNEPTPMDATEPAGSIGPEERPAEGLGSLRLFVTPRIAIDVGGGAALAPGYGAAPFRVLAGLRWIDQKREAAKPRKPVKVRVGDRDRDGVDNDKDECPGEAEDDDGFEDADGCPDPDNDGDGLADADDGCPLIAEDMDGFQDADGCPDGDNDEDGVVDGADKCPTAAEDRDRVADGDGCPETDADGDGVDDGADRCPVEAEDKDGIQDDDGCPDTDADGDGIADQDDKCPTQPENFNDSEDDDGCPDAGRTLAVVDGDTVSFDEKIFFDLNRARVKTRAEPVLNAVANILKAQRGMRIRIEGHADDRGDADWNLTLSKMRAERVREYLIKQGIAADRLEVAGYGADRPSIRGNEEAAREKNRRVEFVIIGRGGDGDGPATPDEP